MIKCVVVDDEPLARECIVNYVNQVDALELVGTANNTLTLTKLLAEMEVDLIFLDIQMPGVNGIDYLKMSKNVPSTIITTAYPSYALEGFQLDVLDYLVKPITFNRFFKAAAKAQDYHQLLQQSGATSEIRDEASDFFFIKCDYRLEKIFYQDIVYVQAMQNYVTIHTKKDKYVTLISMKSIEENLMNRPFLRVHKSYIVSIDKVISIGASELFLEDVTIPISRNYRKAAVERLVGDSLWKK